jgi:FlaA1/EpsC-like NDP-sugar epimerase
LIALSGRRLGVDIEIAFTGLRPGEKLTEELLLDAEEYDRSVHPKMMVGRIQEIEPAVLDRALERLLQLAASGDDSGVRQCLAALIPEANLAQSVPGGVREPAVLRTPRTG